jgi:hypothetical protein
MNYREAVEFCTERLYEDMSDMGVPMVEYQKKFNEKMNGVIKLLSLHLEKPDKENDPDCPTGACPTR